jgi:hypothetical protein
MHLSLYKAQERNAASGEAKMLKRIMLTLTFAAAFGSAGLILADKAAAQWRWSSPYTTYYYGAPAYDYAAPYGYRSYYAPQTYYYGPRAYFYAPRPYYESYYYAPDYYGPAPQVAYRYGMWR